VRPIGANTIKQHRRQKRPGTVGSANRATQLAYNSYDGLLLLGSLGTPLEQSSQVGEQSATSDGPRTYIVQLAIAIMPLNVLDDVPSLYACLFEKICDQIVPLAARESISALIYVRERISARR
jgi:hypothetical protein